MPGGVANEGLLQAMPLYKSISDTITRKRNKALGYIPGEINDIPDSIKKDRQGRPFFRIDTGIDDEERIVIFAAENKRMAIQEKKNLLIDATFKSCPKEFCLLLIFHVYFLGRYWPLAYVLMKTKTEAAYTKAFSSIKELFGLSPDMIVIDFEKALGNALRKVFCAKIQLCYFHVGQSIQRKLRP